jgi:hypothetical protein
LFYKEKVKTVPKNLGELLTARGLAYWIIGRWWPKGLGYI